MNSHRQELDSATLAEIFEACKLAVEQGSKSNERVTSSYEIFKAFSPIPIQIRAPGPTISELREFKSSQAILSPLQLNKPPHQRAEPENTVNQPELAENSFIRR